MQPQQLSNRYLLLALAEQEEVIANAITAKKQLLEEIRSRRSVWREEFKQGKFSMEVEE